MPEAWRIVKERHAATAFTGEGAARSGGRWNSRGVALVYASSSKALAALESLVHLNPPVLFKYTAFRITFPEAVLEEISLSKLPPDWQAEPPPPSAKAVGDHWVHEARSAVLALPSVVIPGEINYLLNPAHPAFGQVRISKPERFAFDPRLLKSATP